MYDSSLAGGGFRIFPRRFTSGGFLTIKSGSTKCIHCLIKRNSQSKAKQEF